MKKRLIIGFSFLLMQMALYPSDITTIGNIHSSSQSLISTQVAGRVETIFIEVGSQVKKNQPLVLLDKRFYEIDLLHKEAALESAKIEMSDAEKNFSRMQKLWEKPDGEASSIPLKRFEDARTKYEQAVVQVKQAQENLNKAKLYLEETTIRSPYDGIVTKKFVDVGESLTTQPVTNIVEIQALDPLYLEFSIPQSYCNQLHIGSPISFEIEGVELKNKAAKIDLFYPSLDENTHALRCRSILNNPDHSIRPGSLARVMIKITTNKAAYSDSL